MVLGYRRDLVPGALVVGSPAAGEHGAEELEPNLQQKHTSSLRAHRQCLGKIQIASLRGCLLGGFWGPAKIKGKCVSILLAEMRLERGLEAGEQPLPGEHRSPFPPSTASPSQAGGGQRGGCGCQG